MKRILVYLFGTSIASLQQESSDALNLFNKTVTKLNDANGRITTEIDKREKEVSKLQAETRTLDAIATRNNVLIAKLNEFLTT